MSNSSSPTGSLLQDTARITQKAALMTAKYFQGSLLEAMPYGTALGPVKCLDMTFASRKLLTHNAELSQQ